MCGGYGSIFTEMTKYAVALVAPVHAIEGCASNGVAEWRGFVTYVRLMSGGPGMGSQDDSSAGSGLSTTLTRT